MEGGIRKYKKLHEGMSFSKKVLLAPKKKP
jgi:hypothetical protein